MELERSDFFGMSDEERIETLNSNCEETIASFSYSKPLSKEEIEKIHELISQNLNLIENLKEQRKEISAEISEKQKEIGFSNREAISGYRELNELVWVVNDFGDKYTKYINSLGEVVQKRRMKGGTQMSIDFGKTGTEDK